MALLHKPPLNHKLALLLVLLLVLIPSASSSTIFCEATADSSSGSCPSLHECIDNQCVHKDIFPLTTREIIGSIALMLLAGLANAGGLGGGALLTPILLIFFQYSANKAIMLVYSIVFGGSFGNFLNVAFQYNPKTNKPYVDYNLSLICMPLMTLGAMVGILINRALAPILMIIGLIIVMIYSGKKVYAKAKNQYAAETNEKAHALLGGKAPTQNTQDVELTLFGGIGKTLVAEPEINSELEAIIKEDHSLFPPKKIGLIALLLSFVILTTLLRGSKEFGSMIGADYCGSTYWVIYLLTLTGCGIIFMKGSALVKHQAQVKSFYQYKEDKNQFAITPTVLNKMMPLSLIAGVLAGLLGLGGGMVMSPTLLQLGMEPQVLAATVGFFVVQTSFITLFQSVMYGDVTQKELMFFLLVAFVGSYGVSWVLNYLVKKYKRPSLILLTLCFVLLLSLVVMPAFSVFKSIDRPEEMFTFRSIC